MFIKLTPVAHYRHCQTRHNKTMETGVLADFLGWCKNQFQEQLGPKGLKWENYKWTLLSPNYTAPRFKSANNNAKEWLQKFYIGPKAFGQDGKVVRERDPGAESFLGGLTPSMGTSMHKRVS